MSDQALYKNLMHLGSGIETCLEKKLIPASLILIYSGIDTAGWLDTTGKHATRDSFLAWVENYLLKAKPLACTSLDLYAARCGLLHTMTPDSRLSSEGKARRICYAWGAAKAADLHRTIDLTAQSSQYVSVHVNDLYEGLRLGLLAFTNDIDRDPVRRKRVHAKARQFFADLEIEVVRNAVSKLECGEGRA